MALVKVTKSVCDNVVISGLVPRLDDILGSIEKETKGTLYQKNIANDENCLFVNNNDSFRLLIGAINTAMYHKDGVHQNWHGTLKLSDNVGINPQ